MIRFIFHILMKKKEKQDLDEEMVKLLEENKYTPYEEWKNNASNKNTSDNS